MIVRTARKHVLKLDRTLRKHPGEPKAGARLARAPEIFARGRAGVMVGPSEHPMNPIQSVGTGGMAILPEWLCMQCRGPLWTPGWGQVGEVRREKHGKAEHIGKPKRKRKENHLKEGARIDIVGR